MADSPVFEWACERLEQSSSMSRLQARGTMRILLNKVGLDSASLGVAQLRVIAVRLLPKELRQRGLPNVDALCKELAECPATVPGATEGNPPVEPEDIFKRLGRRE